MSPQMAIPSLPVPDPSTCSTPMVSVIVPAYNTTAFICEALDSAFAQTYRNFEVIVVNDGSPDTEAMERAIAPYRHRIQYFKQDNRGLAGARNTGIRHARGEYLAFLDSDDRWLPDFLASQLKLFEEVPSPDMVYSDAEYFGDSPLAGKRYMQVCPSDGCVSMESLITETCQIFGSCVSRKQVVIDAGFFDEDFRCGEDYDLWLRVLYRGGRIAYHRKVLTLYRCRQDSLSRDTLKMLQTLMRIYKKADESMELPECTRAVLKRQFQKTQAEFDLESGRKFLFAGEFERAKTSLTKANLFLRRAKLTAALLGLRLAPEWTRLAAITWREALGTRYRLAGAQNSRSRWSRPPVQT